MDGRRRPRGGRFTLVWDSRACASGDSIRFHTGYGFACRHSGALPPRGGSRIGDWQGVFQPKTLGFALGPNVPLVLRGPAQIGSWSSSKLLAPDPDLLERLAALYRDDALLGRSFSVAREAQVMMEGHDPNGMGSRTTPVMELAKAAGEVLGRPDGPRVATIDFGGWDTHISQQGEYGQLTRNLRLPTAPLPCSRQRWARFGSTLRY